MAKQMLKRKDGSVSQRGLYDNMRAAKGSGKKPTTEILKQEKKIKAITKMQGGGNNNIIKTKKRSEKNIDPVWQKKYSKKNIDPGFDSKWNDSLELYQKKYKDPGFDSKWNDSLPKRNIIKYDSDGNILYKKGGSIKTKKK
jgi:hypothetical protein